MKIKFWPRPVFAISILLITAGSKLSAADVTVSAWNPIFKGIDLASGQQQATSAGEVNHRTYCLRVDLTDPDVRLLTTPKCPSCGADTTAENTSLFRENHQLQVAVNGAFFAPADQPLGVPEDVHGLAMSAGSIVSPADDPSHAAAFLFTTNNLPFFVTNNNPGTNTAGIYTALSGDVVLLLNGQVMPTPIPNDLDPRTAIGLSQDRRYMYLMTLDGRQPGWSDGADWYNTALWLQRFGAYHGINVDGGGSTTMVMADCDGSSIRVNRSSYIAAYGRERNVGHNIGVYAAPLQSSENRATVDAASTTALLTWRTTFPGNTRAEYGLSSTYGNITVDSRLLTNHVATLTGLIPGSNYYFRVTSQGSLGQSYVDSCQFRTISSVQQSSIMGLTTAWRYTTNNLDSVNWKAPAYDDSGWMGPGPALLYALENNTAVAPRNTLMPPDIAPAPRTYYFRTHFNYAGPTGPVSLTFSNYVDDGAVFSLNGTEVYRLRMPDAPTVINNASTAIGSPCAGTVQAGDAATTCPDVFTITGNLVQGDNVMAVSVHNLPSGNDIVFGCALLKNSTSVSAPKLQYQREGDLLTLFWNGDGFVLQQSTDIGTPTNWTDVPTTNPAYITNNTATFYRLRN